VGISFFIRIQGGKRNIGKAVIEKPKYTQSERDTKILLLTNNSDKNRYRPRNCERNEVARGTLLSPPKSPSTPNKKGLPNTEIGNPF
jgi:hypothetical protein